MGADGKISGYGCTTYYLVHTEGLNWWFYNKYKFSAQSTDKSWWFPVRLRKVAWKATWSAGNQVYDGEPASTQTISNENCVTITATAGIKYGSISISGKVCPDKHGPWDLASTKSGAMWQGVENDTDYE